MLIIFSFLCALIPILFGTIVFLGWYFTRHYLFGILGVYGLIVGIVLVLLGFNLLAIDSFQNQKPLCRGKRLLIIMLLLLNWPLASTYIYLVWLVESRIEFDLFNDTQKTLDSVVLSVPRTTLKFEAIEPGEKLKIFFYPQSEGALKLKVSSGDKEIEMIINPYVTRLPSELENSKIIISSGLKTTVINLANKAR